jgi:molybdopterin-guanine dinucleotide biosynthesis protein A
VSGDAGLARFLASVQPVVLVGGKSRRFGRDKLVEPWGGKVLVQHPIGALRRVFGARVKLVGECDPRIPPLADGVIPDTRSGVGPIGGIAAALEYWNGPVFVLAGDMPAVSEPDIRNVIEHARRHEGPLAVLAATDRVHPCFGLYRPGCLPLLLDRLSKGELRLAAALPSERCAAVAVSQGSTKNVNHPESDVQTARTGTACGVCPADRSEPAPAPPSEGRRGP